MCEIKENIFQENSTKSSIINITKENLQYKDNLKYFTKLYKIPKYLEKVINNHIILL